ncbi:hypothetical protein NDU88_001841 [Pleurodeles waltl]|uniref:Uncharacterized protein n=1 Tax=Pleurodeles waltl TaxID=8319 RepID=A0AAV7T0B2_PLEWA|nr:hypothetical protein NDU88_001841 [Pleurodeles waltl]
MGDIRIRPYSVAFIPSLRVGGSAGVRIRGSMTTHQHSGDFQAHCKRFRSVYIRDPRPFLPSTYLGLDITVYRIDQPVIDLSDASRIISSRSEIL